MSDYRSEEDLPEHRDGEAIPGRPVTDVGPNITPGVTTETATPGPAENKWTADHLGNIPTPADPDKLIPQTPRAAPEKDEPVPTEPLPAEEINDPENKHN